MRDYKALKVWEKAHGLVLSVYEITRSFPRDEQYGLVSQIRRSAASVPANIAEGCGRSGNSELGYFCNIAMGSASELEYHLLLALDLGFLPESEYKQLSDEVSEIKRMLRSFVNKLNIKANS